ncbi:MAG: IPT/TIG domain-containing protein, partial [Actinomycetota bacterium]|nr:IPT/TIG domain-containing protein [Actinomycetota bacterium]
MTTGVAAAHAPSGSTVSTTVSQAVASTQRYVAYIANTGPVNTQAASTPVTVTWSSSSSPPAPAVTALSPSYGSSLGGTSVTIKGANFTGATAVRFGSTAA